MKGRSAKPAAVKKLQGNAGKRRTVTPEPQPEVSASPEILPAKLFFSPGWEPAAWLSDAAKRVWCEQLPIALRDTKLQQSGLIVFASYCDAVARLHKYSKDIEDNGATYKTATGHERKRPQVEMRDKAANDVRNYASELNLTPKSWIGSMGTFAGRQLDMFMNGGRGSAPLQGDTKPSAAAPAPGADLDSFLGSRPTVQ